MQKKIKLFFCTDPDETPEKQEYFYLILIYTNGTERTV